LFFHKRLIAKERNMVGSWIEQAHQFKSPLSVVAGFLLRSRQKQAERAKSRTEEIQQLRKELEQQRRTIHVQREQIAERNSRIAQLEIENQRRREEPPTMPHDPPLPHHEFGPKMISLCVNLARRIGLRPVPDVLKMILDWLAVKAKLPTWTAVRIWMLRVGVAAIQRPIEAGEDWVWLADHSNQIGPEKVLAIIGLRASKMPPPGQPLRHADVRVLELSPGTSWKREDMAAAYEQLAQRCGAPVAVLVDGAVELREGAETLRKRRENLVILSDFKHFAANVLKKVVGQDERFSEFSTRLGGTRSAIQQTELAHLTPPSPKPKARFMNLAPTLRWAEMVSWQLSQPRSQARHEITAERMNDKLGWLREFRDDIQRWNACQEVVCASSQFINDQGLFRGVTRQLRDHLRSLRNGRAGDGAKDSRDRRQVIASLLHFVRRSESQLAGGQRLPLSTEILESSFSLFKQLERQHSKGGFTSLLAAYGGLLQATTPASIRQDFTHVSVKQMQTWVSEKLGQTLASKRQTAYRECRNAA
jgi:hypothetical protein